jgi:hypothetical protein
MGMNSLGRVKTRDTLRYRRRQFKPAAMAVLRRCREKRSASTVHSRGPWGTFAAHARENYGAAQKSRKRVVNLSAPPMHKDLPTLPEDRDCVPGTFIVSGASAMDGVDSARAGAGPVGGLQECTDCDSPSSVSAGSMPAAATCH